MLLLCLQKEDMGAKTAFCKGLNKVQRWLMEGVHDTESFESCESHSSDNPVSD